MTNMSSSDKDNDINTDLRGTATVGAAGISAGLKVVATAAGPAGWILLGIGLGVVGAAFVISETSQNKKSK